MSDFSSETMHAMTEVKYLNSWEKKKSIEFCM